MPTRFAFTRFAAAAHRAPVTCPGPGPVAPAPSNGHPRDDQAACAAPAFARGPSQDSAAGIAPDDWDDLFHAVEERLARAVTRDCASLGPAAARQPLEQIRATVLECVAALDMLHAELGAEQARRAALERELFNAKAALAQVRAALIGM